MTKNFLEYRLPKLATEKLLVHPNKFEIEESAAAYEEESSSDDDEDISDQAFEKRHEAAEAEEKARILRLLYPRQ